jgi:hypothetical protein
MAEVLPRRAALVAATALLALLLAGAGCEDEPAPVTPGPATASLELADAHFDASPSNTQWAQVPPGQVQTGEAQGSNYADAPRGAEQVVFVGGVWLVVSRSGKGGVELTELRADWSQGRRVTGLSGSAASRWYITVVPDQAWRRAMVIVQNETPREHGRFTTDIAVLDLARARLDVLHQVPDGGPAVWAGKDIAVAYQADDGGNAVVLVDPATRGMREICREPSGSHRAYITTLWSSPRGTRVAFDRNRAYVNGSGPRTNDVVVIDVVAGKGVPVALDSRRSYYHGVVKWESEDSLQFWVSEGDAKASLYRAKLRPPHADLQ